MKHTVEITSLAYGGDGIGRIEGQVCFVPFGLPGDVLEIEITRKAKGVLWGKIVTIAQASPDRLPGTAHSGGCMWAHFAYPAQAAWKLRLVKEALARYAGIEADIAWREEPTLRTGWRTRAELHGDGERLGLYAHASHEIVESTCPLMHPKLAAAVARLRAAGWRRDVMVTVNPEGEEVLACGRAATAEARAAVTAWDDPRSTSPPAQFSFDGIPILNGTFSQASLLLNRMLRAEVAAMISADGPLLDAYCGNGNLSLAYLTSREVVGVDLSEDAIAGAQALGGDFRAGDEWAMVQAIRERSWGSIVLDPPRTGAKALLPALGVAQADEIVYVSCDPVALARDLKALCGTGWRIDRAVALDMFPNTAHIETVVRMTR